jgi:DNA (cytosine-5)-methyltransferase 1
VNVVKIVRPKIFVFENVKGILSKDKGKIFKEIENAFGNPENFNGDRYYLHYKVCRAVEYGIPQRRERVILIGLLNHDFDIEDIFEEVRTNIREREPHFFDAVTLRDAISDIPAPSSTGVICLSETQTLYQERMRDGLNKTFNHIASKHNQLAIGRMDKVLAGQNWTVLNENIKSVHSGAYGRLEWNSPTMTITTRFDTPAGGRFIHPDDNRTLTPREAARVQSFPDSFEFTGSKSSICKQIGNAVPPKLAFFLANVVKKLIRYE